MGAKAPRRNQKLKILYLLKILKENTDEEHDITLQEIMTLLEGYDVTAERKSLYDDMEKLKDFGYDIIMTQYGRSFHYKLASREFELAELKLLVDSVQSARFLSEKKSAALIRKLENLTSRFEASKLQRQVYVSGRIKAMNESIFYNVDSIHSAIGEDRNISFKYFNWNLKKEPQLRKNGERYKVSPWALTWNNDNYYMIAYDKEADMIKHYRVDKMLEIERLAEKREGREKYKAVDVADYTKKMFSMFDGRETKVKLRCYNSLVGVIIDRFGKETVIMKDGDEHFTATVSVAISRQFFGWVFALGEGVEIVGPDEVVDMVRDEIKKMAFRYLDKNL
ncbi:MAG: WYL domain-containing protein [Eubacterium sp.]|nr:WYL domain-containing protein [Eubacterium sp.]